MIEGMLIDRAYYVISCIQVFTACAFLELILPLIMWRRYLHNKSFGYRFAFCLITQNAFLINLVLLLGFLKICNRFTLFAGIVLLYIVVNSHYARGGGLQQHLFFIAKIKHIIIGTKRPKTLYIEARQTVYRQVSRIPQWAFWQHLRIHLIEYIFLFTAVLYTANLMTHNANNYHSVQFSDIPVHQAWIYELAHNGILFSDGIYPFGMHAMVYSLHTLFFLDLREVLLYYGAFQTVLLLLSIYLLARKIFRWKYSALLILIFFALFMNQGRYEASLPQETGMFSVTLCAYFLIAFLHTPLQKYVLQKDSQLMSTFRVNQYFTRRYLTTDALMFMLCVSIAIAYHFYAAIAACLFVVAILLVNGFKMLRKQYWVPVILSGVLGILIAVVPFAASYVSGTPFQESMNWALSVLEGKEWGAGDYLDNLEASTVIGSASGDDETQTGPAQAQSVAPEETLQAEASPLAGLSTKEKIMFVYRAMKEFVEVTLLGKNMTLLLIVCFGAGIGSSLLSLPFQRIRQTGQDYASMILYALIILVFGAAQTLDIPELIPTARAGTFIAPYLGIVYAISADFIFGLLSTTFSGRLRLLLSTVYVSGCIMIIVFVFRQGLQQKYYEVNLAYYNEPEYLVRHIRQDFPRNSFTIVSTTDERYQVIDYGYHENLSKFMNMVNGKEPEFKLPTPYVFFFIEKIVLQDYYYGRVEVDLGYAQKDFVYIGDNQDYYFQRAVLESQAFYWAEAYRNLYPRTMRVYFENDLYIAYLLEQNPYYLNSFQMDYLTAKE